MTRLALVAVVLALGAPAFAQVDKKVEKQLQASYRQVVAGLRKKDAKAVLSRMTEDVTLTEMGRTLNRKEFEAMLNQQIQMMDLQSSSIKFSKLSAKGDLARGEYTETSKAKVRTPDGKISVMESVARYRATFKKSGGEWKLKSSETIGTPKVKMDGKPFKLPGAP